VNRQDRTPGYYWVRTNYTGWMVRHYNEIGGRLEWVDNSFDPKNFDTDWLEIDENRLPPPDEQKTRTQSEIMEDMAGNLAQAALSLDGINEKLTDLIGYVNGEACIKIGGLS
jgi:hypothetical protein